MILKEAVINCFLSAETSRAATTAKSYRFGLKTFSDFLEGQSITGEDSIDLVSMEHFVKYPGWLNSNGFSRKTTNVYLSGVKFFLDWLVINGNLRPDYSQTLRYTMATKQAKRKREFRLPKIPEKGAADKILEAVRNLDEPTPRKERNIALVLFLMTTGCRNVEAVQLNIKDIDLTNRKVKLNGKGNKDRWAFFSRTTAEALKDYWKARGAHDLNEPAFARHDWAAGRKPGRLSTTSVRTIVSECVELAGLDKGTFSPHSFRHAFAIKMLQETHDLALVQDLLGHSSPTVTRVYATISPDDLQAAYKDVWS